MTRVLTKPPPREQVPAETYAQVFENFPTGKVVLEDLVRRFGQSPYVPGGLEGDRATCFNSGKRAVLDFILGRINQAAGVDESAGEE
jgi:hypothetical protein